ncbi:uncharacterized protein UTRI_03215_B [Ustilago trichophora]|uniref:Uncharacterized protein n=1 Tax=Ustilago trichophora TaxID=86804 RepID=A0A5C3E5H5_9BASI|nr:uncharacterized protein UTRI_03215_B [Ustilago trichophora]
MRVATSAASRLGQVTCQQNGHRQTHRTDAPAERAHKKRRLVQLGSSSPPFTTASHHLAPNSRLQRDKVAERTASASTSPKATRKRRIVIVQRKNPLELRSSSPAPPPPNHPTGLGRLFSVPQAPQSGVVNHADETSPNPARSILERKRQRDRSDPSSPIGTFGGHMIGRSDRSPRCSRSSTVDSASRDLNIKTVGLPALGHAPQLRTRFGPRTRPPQVAELPDANDNENTETVPAQGRPKRRATKRIVEEKAARQKRQRTKIQRIQLGGCLPSSSADQQPFSDADHHLNSQPDADEHLRVDVLNAADESEISYFPTLPPACLPSSRVRKEVEATHEQAAITTLGAASEHRFPLADQNLQQAPTFVISTSTALNPQDETLAQEDEHVEEGDTSVGLLEVLSQNAMRKIVPDPPTIAASPQSSPIPAPVEAAHSEEAPHVVLVDFAPSHVTHQQAQQIVKSIIQSKAGSKRWSAAHPDLIEARPQASIVSRFKPGMTLQASWRPPSKLAVCRDLGLSSAQMRKGPATDLPAFVHCSAIGCDDEAQTQLDDANLSRFEHGLCSAGYRLSYAMRGVEAACDGMESIDVPHLQPFDAVALRQRMRSRRKEVVKIIVPFSEPRLSPLATRARFLTPHPSRLADQPDTSVTLSSQIVLVWMQSTAQAFLHALETMTQASLAVPAQNSCHSIASTESDLYPCPILHYTAHAQSAASENKASSHVVLYVHLDRLEEARSKLADLELGSTACYRPFNDPLVRLLVTSLQGEPLCLI